MLNKLFLKIPALSSSAENSAVVFLERLVVKNVSNVCEQNRGPKRDVIQPVVTRLFIGQLGNTRQKQPISARVSKKHRRIFVVHAIFRLELTPTGRSNISSRNF